MVQNPRDERRCEGRGAITLPVPAEPRWFWSERWQEREREVDEHVAAGRVAVHESTEDFLAHLAELDAESRTNSYSWIQATD